MAIIRKKELRKLDEKELNKKLIELKSELAKEKANISIGASATSPGKLNDIKRAIARIQTINNEISKGKEFSKEPLSRRAKNKRTVRDNRTKPSNLSKPSAERGKGENKKNE